MGKNIMGFAAEARDMRNCRPNRDDYTALRVRVAKLEEALNEISTLYWVDAPAPEEMRRIARRALEEK